ncbi:MAG: phosphatase PAP2 family protein [Ignavibacteriales bacterium]|nr:phosphatase PAP2 family protein [Ignavibacteriales bacterium]
MFTVGVIQLPLRLLTGRARPDTEEGNSSFKFLDGANQKRSSFFSGHAAIAFGFSTVLAYQINNPLATIGLYGLATVTPWARLYLDRHWFSDAVIGVGIGLYVGQTIVSWHKDQSPHVFLPTLHGVVLLIRL